MEIHIVEDAAAGGAAVADRRASARSRRTSSRIAKGLVR